MARLNAGPIAWRRIPRRRPSKTRRETVCVLLDAAIRTRTAGPSPEEPFASEEVGNVAA